MGLVVFNQDRNFWEMNPVMKVPKVFKDLYDKDKTKNKEESSRLMWALAFVYDYDSKFYPMRKEERMQLVCRDFLNNADFRFDKQLVEAYELIQKSPERTLLDTLYEKMYEINDFLKTTRISEETAKLINMFMDSSLDYIDKLDKIKNRVEKQLPTKQNRGDKKDSLLEDEKI
jgi:hypothetical protein